MRTTTWRWYLTHMAWERKRWKEPDQYEYLLAKIVQTIKQLFAKESICLEDQFIVWKDAEDGPKEPETRKEAAEKSKRMWLGFFGSKVTRKTRKRKRRDGE